MGMHGTRGIVFCKPTATRQGEKLPTIKLELKRKKTKYSTPYLTPNGSFTEKIFL